MMEKPSKMKSKILASLPKAASPVTFQLSSPLSPVRSRGRKGLSSTVVSIIPIEARRKPKNSSFEQREPASPKVSCMGQVTNRKKKKKLIKSKLVLQPGQHTTQSSSAKEVEKKKKVFMMKIFKRGKKGDRVDVSITDDSRAAARVAERVTDDSKAAARVAERVPSLGRMKKFTGSRGRVLENFDWRICEEQVQNSIVPCTSRKASGEVAVEPRRSKLVEEKKQESSDSS